MKHEDFKTLNVEDVLGRTLNHVREITACACVHWISSHGLQKVNGSTEDNWRYSFMSTDMVGQHLLSQPVADYVSTFQMWRQIGALYPQPWLGQLPPRMLKGETSRLVTPVYFDAEFLGLLVVDRPRGDRDLVALIGQIHSGIDVATKYISFAYKYIDARNDSYVDEVTGLYNQRYLPMVLDHEIAWAKREQTPFTLLFLDVDYFKQVNDNRGHQVGSYLLKILADVFKGQVRNSDYCFRYGGDEFIIILGNAASKDAVRVAERIRVGVQDRTFAVDGEELRLTVSIGLASFPEHAQTTSRLIQLADQAMYSGKNRSRNVVFVAS